MLTKNKKFSSLLTENHYVIYYIFLDWAFIHVGFSGEKDICVSKLHKIHQSRVIRLRSVITSCKLQQTITNAGNQWFMIKGF